MRSLFVVTFCLFTARSDVNATLVTGHVGRSVSIKCSYPRSYAGHEKYFCKGVGWNCQVLIKTGKRNTLVRGGRFSLYDNTGAGFFTVGISGLRLKDAGKYQCAADRPGFDDPTKVHLKVAEPEEITFSTTMMTKTATPTSSSSQVLIIVGTVIAGLVIGLILFIIYMRRCRTSPEAGSSHTGNSNTRTSDTGNTGEVCNDYMDIPNQCAVFTVATHIHYLSSNTLKNISVYQSLNPSILNNSQQFKIPFIPQLVLAPLKKAVCQSLTDKCVSMKFQNFIIMK